MQGFMTAGLALLLLAIAGVIGYVTGRGRGRREAAAVQPAGKTSDAGTYRAGYLAGHLAGWRDAQAKAQGVGLQPAPQQPVAAPMWTMPSDLQAPVRLPAPPNPPPSYGPVPGPQVIVAPGRPQASLPIPVQRESPEAAAARKEKRDRQNINITLYVASLLLVAAGALFVGTSLPELLRFVAIWAITFLFYVTGLVIHSRVPRLRPAATAFTGTGLALIPVTGLAMYNFALHHGPTAWLATSLLGTVAYVFAAVRLDNKVLAVLSLSFVVSTAWSGVSVLGGALVWYFTALIGVAVLLTLGALLKPRWMPPLYVRPLMVLHPFVVPAVGLAVTLTPTLLAKGEYAMVMMMCGLYFAVMTFVPSANYRLAHSYGARAAFTLAVLGMVWDASADVSYVLLAGIICLGVQSLGVAFGGKRLAPRIWWNDAVSCLGLQLVAAVVLTVMLGVGSFDVPEFAPLFIAMATAMLLGWKLGHGAEFSPAAVLVLSMPFAGSLGAWPVAELLTSAAVYWFLRAAVRKGPLRTSVVLAGRLAVTLAVPAVVAGVFVGHPDRVSYAMLAVVASTALQQVLSAVLVRTGVGTVAPQASTAGFAGAAMAGLVALAVIDTTPGRPVVAAAVGAVLVAGLISGWLALPKVQGGGGSYAGSKVAWQPTVGEFIAPAAAAMAGLVASVAVSLTLGNVVLMAATAYFCATGLRLPRGLHRKGYWWLARGTGTLLAASAYFDVVLDGGGLRLAGEKVTVGIVLLIAFALQMVLPLLPGTRRHYPRSSMLDAAVLLAAMCGVACFLTISATSSVGGQHDGWQPGTAAAVTALAAAATGAVLRRYNLAWVFAPAALLLLVALRFGNIRDLEILLAIFAAYSVFMLTALQDRVARGAYLLGVRILSGALITILVADFTESAAATSVTLALVLISQSALQWLLRGRLADLPLQQAAAWATLGTQLLLPFTYLLTTNYDGGGRWVVLLEFALVPAAAAIASRRLGARGAQYFGAAAVIAWVVVAGPTLEFPVETWLHQPLLDKFQVPLVLLSLAAAAIVGRAVFRPASADAGDDVKDRAERYLWLVSALAFTFTGGVIAVDASLALTGLAVLMLASVLFAASHFEGMPSIYAAAAPTALVGAVTAVEGLLQGLQPSAWSSFLPWLIGAVGSGSAMYAACRSGRFSITSHAWRRNALAVTSIMAFGSTAAVGFASDETSMVGAFLVLLTGVLVVIEVPDGKRLACEIVALATLAGFQRAVLFVDGSKPDWFWAVQWYVLAGAVMAGLRYVDRQRSEGQSRLIVTSGLLSLTSLGIGYSGTPSQQSYSLLAYALLLVAGLVLAERMFVWWGAAGVAASVMWALRSYAFAMLALVAVALIVLAIWRLNRKPAVLDSGAQSEEHLQTRGQDGIR